MRHPPTMAARRCVGMLVHRQRKIYGHVYLNTCRHACAQTKKDIRTRISEHVSACLCTGAAALPRGQLCTAPSEHARGRIPQVPPLYARRESYIPGRPPCTQQVSYIPGLRVPSRCLIYQASVYPAGVLYTRPPRSSRQSIHCEASGSTFHQNK